MSQLKVDTITDELGTGSPSLPNGLTVGGVNYPSTGPLSNRNKIINGAMVIDQRNAGAAVTGGVGYTFTVDRFKFYSAASSKLSGQRSTISPSGFTNSLLLTSLAATTPAAGDEYQLYHQVEGFNISDLGWGAASAQPVTLSFWVRSSLTGTFSGCITSGTKSYVFTYAIDAANTFEQKIITIPGETAGTWNATNGSGIQVNWDLGSGSNFAASAGSWVDGFKCRTSGSVNVIGTNGATFYVTGVQLEAGTVATPFEHRSFGQELALCQRYFWKLVDSVMPFNIGWYNSRSGVHFNAPVPMRAAPTVTFVGSPTANPFYAFNGGNEFRNFNFNSAEGRNDPSITAILLSLTDTGGSAPAAGTAGGFTQPGTALLVSAEL
jgi:hypothetical protein